MLKLLEIFGFQHRRGSEQLNIKGLTTSQQSKGSNRSGLKIRKSNEPNEIQSHKDNDCQLEIIES